MGLYCANDVLEVPNAARQSVDARYHQNVPLAEKFQNGPQFIPSRRRRAAALLRPDDLATGSAQGILLQFKVLVCRAHAGIADDGHVGSLSR